MFDDLDYRDPIRVDRRGRGAHDQRSIWSLFPQEFRTQARQAIHKAFGGLREKVGHIVLGDDDLVRTVFWQFRPIVERGVVTAVELTTAREIRPCRRRAASAPIPA